MINSQREYREAKERLAAQRDNLDTQRERLNNQGVSALTIKNSVDVTLHLLNRWQEDIEMYERLKAKDITALDELTPGQKIIGLRIIQGISQAELARRLQLPRAQICRDERNEYYGLTIQRREKILAALGVQEVVTFQWE